MAREVGPTAIASISVAIAAYGIAHAWSAPVVAYFLFFAGSLCVASLIERGFAEVRSQWRALAAP